MEQRGESLPRHLQIPFDRLSSELMSYKTKGLIITWSNPLINPIPVIKKINENVVCLNAGLLNDPKLLLGTFSVDEEPGVFRWKDGFLLEAVRTGMVIVLEDIHLANNDLLVLLHQLVGDGTFYDTYRSENISVHPEFRIIGLSNISLHLCNNSLLNYQIEASLWTVYNVDLEIDPKEFFINKYSLDYTELLWDICLNLHKDLGLAARLFSRCAKIKSIKDIDTRNAIYQHIFSLYPNSSFEALNYCRGKLAIESFKLNLENTENNIKLGFLDCEKLGPSLEAPQTITVNETTKATLSSIISSFSNKEPVLLIGETGTGKTTIVQYFSRLMGQPNFSVINLSQQSEASDLLGGYKPLSKASALKSLLLEFRLFFSENFSVEKNSNLFLSLDDSFAQNDVPRILEIISQVLQRIPTSAKGIEVFERKFDSFKKQIANIESGAIYYYEEGILLKAIRNGHWILLDEINLASTEVLAVIYGLLGEPDQENLNIITDAGSSLSIKRHSNFKLFACMNPATDYGKKDLPDFLKRVFSTIFVPDPDSNKEEFLSLITDSLGADYVHIYPEAPSVVSEIYYSLKSLANQGLLVGEENKKPLFNLRSLSRALGYAVSMDSWGSPKWSLYEGLLLAFSTGLDQHSCEKCLNILGTQFGSSRHKINPKSQSTSGGKNLFDIFYGYPLKRGNESVAFDDSYIFTPTVERNINNLARAISALKYPILLEGPTSTGKTSSIYFLAKKTGNRVIRINNHEYTELSEYIGSYSVNTSDGSLYFKDGILVKALRNGYWLLLDELNLAPTEVLEALNRLLDDNRELYIPETSETIRPHPNFMLFATQNPAGSLYGGRKHLSRAFRSRFLEINVPPIPSNELETILSDKCRIAPSQAKKLAAVYQMLQERRTIAGNVFAGKQALITLRDLFRWASRKYNLTEDLALNGVDLICERCRSDSEWQVILDIIRKVFKTDLSVSPTPDHLNSLPIYDGIVWTSTMKRLFKLCLKCIENGEPILLVGETGCGKTSVCNLLSQYLGRPLVTLNCHQNTETSDFIGTFRPSRDRSAGKLFEFYEGPLITSMQQGSIFLMDEISLSEDSVLEGLNSVLEPERTITVTEGNDEIKVIEADQKFVFIATMNPGGDFGKKELSPALRSRFTEIWVEETFQKDDLLLLINSSLECEESFSNLLADIFIWMKPKSVEFRFAFSLRDLKNLLLFLNSTAVSLKYLWEGLEMIFFDRTGLADLGKECLAQFKLPKVHGKYNFSQSLGTFGVDPFFYSCLISDQIPKLETCFQAPSTLRSARKILRALKIKKAILLEGPPGVGKSTIISTLATAAGRSLCRYNLSEQTDLHDLFGSELPVPNGLPGQFSWVDGPFLTAIRNGDWVLLDEINLASQSILEGLNAILDHRGEAYIPELDKSFKVHPDTRIFAAQNPVFLGGSRKSLPKSFLNRFTCVWFELLTFDDYKVILAEKFPLLDKSIINSSVRFVQMINPHLSSLAGAPLELNLRDLFRLFNFGSPDPRSLLKSVLFSRFRNERDRSLVEKICEQTFGCKITKFTDFKLLEGSLQIGSARVDNPNLTDNSFIPFSFQLRPLEALINSVNGGYLSILTGASGAGKSEMIKFLANCCFRTKSNEIYLTPETDTMELLGTFVQFDYRQKLYELLTKAEIPIDNDNVVDQCKQLIASSHPLYNEYTDLEGKAVSSGGRFEWQDGPLIKAMTRGEWIVLSHANLASSAVLDRLNSLFEPNGVVYLPEQGALSDGSVRTLKPHPNFRAFLLYDPKFGEISRAMRNRGIEIFVDITECDLLDQFKLTTCSSLLRNNIKSIRECSTLAVKQFSTEDKIVNCWLTQNVSNIRFSTDFSLFFDKSNAIVKFFDSIMWNVNVLSKDLIFDELRKFFDNCSLTDIALSYKNITNLDLTAPEYYDAWQTKYRSLHNFRIQSSNTLNGKMGRILDYLNLLTRRNFQFSNEQADFLLCSKAFRDFNMQELVLLTHGFGLKRLFGELKTKLETCTVGEILDLTHDLNEFSSTNFQVGKFKKPSVQGDLFDIQRDPNEIWESRLLAQKCIQELWEDELAIRMRYLSFKLGSVNFDFTSPLEQFEKLSQTIKDLENQVITRSSNELARILFTFKGIFKFLSENRIEDALMLRKTLTEGDSSGCRDLVLLYCSRLDPLLWNKMSDSRNDFPSYSLDILEFFNNPKKFLYALLEKLPDQKIEPEESMYYYKGQTQDEDEQEDEKFIDSYLNHQEQVTRQEQIYCWEFLQIMSKDGNYIFNQVCSSIQRNFNNENSFISDNEAFNYVKLLSFPKYESFYSSVDVNLLLGKLSLINNLKTKSDEFLNKFPYNESLQDVSRLCADFSKLSINRSSMISLLSYLSRILVRADEWQKLADKAHLLPMDPLIEWIIEWRRLEVMQWQQLFSNIRAEFEKEAIIIGMNLVKILIDSPDSPELIFTVDSFLLACPAGQLVKRLEIIQSIIQFSRSSNLLNLLASYYKINVVAKVEEYISSIKSPLESELKLFLQTMHWNDHNLYSMQASISKSHRTLARILRKYKDGLSRPVSSIIAEVTGATLAQSELPKPIFKKLKLKGNFNEGLVKKNLEVMNCFDSYASPFEKLIDLVKTNIDELINKPIQAKQSALASLFKLVKSLGIKLFKSPPKDVSLTEILYKAGTKVSDPILMEIFAKLAGKWNEFETSINNPHPDVGPREIEIFRNILYQLLDFTFSLNFPDFKLVGLLDYINSKFLCFKREDFKSSFSSSFQETLNQALKDSSHISQLEKLRDILKSSIERKLRYGLNSYFGFSDVIISKPIQGCKAAVEEFDCESQIWYSDASLGYLEPIYTSKWANVGQVDEFGVMNNHLTRLFELLNDTSSGITTALLDIENLLPQLLSVSHCIEKNFELLEESYSKFVCTISTITHLTSVLFNLFTQLVRQGFCRPADADINPETSTLDEGKLEGGTGMAEGTGQENVSKEIEFEEQITDLKGEQQKQDETANSKNENEQGCEMEQDFEGVLNDVMQEDNKLDDNEDDDSGGEKFESGSGADENGEVTEVDPTLWEDEEKENSGATLEENQKGVEQATTSCDNIDAEAQDKEDEIANQSADEPGEANDLSNDSDSNMDSVISSEEESLVDQMEIENDESDIESEDQENSVLNEAREEEMENSPSDAEEPEQDNLPPMYSKQNPEDILPDQLFDDHNDDNLEGSGVATSGGPEQNDLSNKRSLSDEGTGKNIFCQSETKKPKKSSQQISGNKPNEEPIQRSLYDILEDELPFESSSLNRNVVNQQYNRSKNGLSVLGKNVQGDPHSFNNPIEEQPACKEYSAEMETEEPNPSDVQNIEVVEGLRRPTGQSEEAQSESIRREPSVKPHLTWSQLQQETDILASNLCEQLRLIMVPTVAARLKGDYKSGKRLNIKKVLPFIASGYRRNKIWMRRTKLSSRNYRIVLAIDNSRSMQNNAAGEMAMKSAAIIKGAMKKLESGSQFSILSFGSDVKIIDSEDTSTSIHSNFTFDENQTNILQALEKAGSLYSEDLSKSPQLSIFISDGVCTDHSLLRQTLNIQQSRNIFSLFVIIDKNAGKQSITELTQVDKDPVTGKLVMKKYLQDFPFSFYIVVQDIKCIPDYVSEALRQWFRSIQSE
jgi:midasin